MFAFGHNAYGQLGIGSTATVYSPTRVEKVSNVRQVVCNANATFVRLEGGTVLVAGVNAHTHPHSVARLPKFSSSSPLLCIAVSASDLLACSPNELHRLPLNRMMGGGESKGKIVGAGTGSSPLEFNSCRPPAGDKFLMCSAGALFHCCLTEQGRVLTGGMAVHSQLGLLKPSCVVDGLVEVEVPSEASKVIKIVCGGCHTVALTATGQCFGWGRNDRGQLGIPHLLEVPTPTMIPNLEGLVIVDIACGDYFSLLQTEDGRLFVSGNNDCGQLGLGPEAPLSIPTFQQVLGLETKVHRLAAGGGYGSGHSVVLSDEGVFVAGSNSCGQLGLSNTTTTTESSFVRLYADCISDRVHLACGWRHTVLWDPTVTATINADDFLNTPFAVDGKLGNLPADVCAQVILFVRPPELKQLSLVSSAWNEYVRFSPRWEMIFQKMQPRSYASLKQREEEEMTDIAWRSELNTEMNARVRSNTREQKGGFFGSLFSMFSRLSPWKKNARILMIGLDAAGKTTILYKLKLGETITTIPTIGFNVETVEYKNISFTCWDVGGPDKIRPLWRHYYTNTNAVIVVIDSNDEERLPSLKDEIAHLFVEDSLRDAAFLFFANKQDLPMALSAEAICRKLELHHLRDRKWFIQGCVATTGDGLYDGLDWLMQALS